MDTSILSVVLFVILTVLYYAIPSIGKPVLSLSALQNAEEYTLWNRLCMQRMGIFLLVTVVIQLILSSSYLMVKCGGNIAKNIGAAAFYTFLPWVALFGTLMTIVHAFPGFKSAFSNVVGYFAVSSAANKLFSELLVDSSTRASLDSISDPAKKSQLATAVEAAMKISDNQSVLVNQMNIDNFQQMWQMLTPLMKDGMASNAVKQQELLNIVTLKDNIGEAMWYIYTAIIVSAISYTALSSRACELDPSTIAKNRKEYLQKQNETQEQDAIATSGTTYVA